MDKTKLLTSAAFYEHWIPKKPAPIIRSVLIDGKQVQFIEDEKGNIQMTMFHPEGKNVIVRGELVW